MRYIYIICFTLLFSLTGQAQTKRTINVATAGTLPNYISDSEKYTIEELTLTGNLNGTDFRLLRDMAGCNYLGEFTNGQLKVLDISGANIVTGGDRYVDTEVLPEYPGSYHYNVEKANEIPKYVFHGCKKLVTLRIPNTITSLQDYAFCFCENLTSFTIPNSVTSIGSHTFSDCYGLTSITIPNSVTSIGVRAFQYCSGLTSFTIPSSVTSIDNNPVSNCSNLSSIVVASGNTKYDSRNNCNAIIEKSSNKLISGCKNTVIPNGVTIIDAYAFRGSSGLSSITIPNSVTSIGVAAFNGCSSLTSITIPNSVTKIETGAFSSCPGLTSVISEIQNPFKIDNDVFPSDTYTKAPLTVPYGTKSKYQGTNGWKNFTNIVESTPSTKRTINVATAGTLPNYISDSEKYTIEELTLTGELNGTDFRLLRDMAGNDYQGFSTDGRLAVLDMSGAKIVAGGEKYMDIISSSMSYTVEKANELPIVVFRNCIKLTSVVLPNTVSSLQDLAFWSCNALTSITIPKSVTSIGMNPFIFCNNLSSIVVESGNTKYDSRNNCNAIIEKSSNTLISGCKNTVIPNGVTSIGDYAFAGCSNLTSVTIPNSVTSIGSSAFQGCSGFTSITIPNSVTSIGSYAFQHCSSLTSVTIPNGVTSIEESTFNYCTSLTSITIPGNVTSIGSNAFNNCTGLTSVISEIQNPFEFPYPVFSLNTYNNATLTVPYGTKSKYQATSYWNNFKNIVESEGPITVTAQSYSRKYGEANPTFSYTVSGGTLNGTPQITCDATSSSSVGTYTIKISKGSVTNSNVTFVDGTLTVTKAPLTITAKSYTRKQGEQNPTFEVTYSGFKNGETESVLTKKPTVTTTATIDSPPGTYDIVASGAEAKNYDISYVKGTLTVTENTSPSTSRTINVATAGTLPNYISDSEKYTIEELTLTGNLNGTDFRLLRDMAGNNYLGNETNGKLRVLDMSGAKVVAGGLKYLDTDNLGSMSGSYHYAVEIANNMPTYVFAYCNKLTSVSNPNSVTSIGDHAFDGCYRLTSITIPNSVTSIGSGAFQNCSGLTSITIPNSVTSIGDEAFYYCSGLTSITISNSVTSIGSHVFGECRSLSSIKVNSNNTKYDSRDNCNAIIETSSNTLIAGCKNTMIPNSVTSIGSWAFAHCLGLTSITIPNSVTSIDDYAFCCCYDLTSIIIPNSVTSIGNEAFNCCFVLTSITIPNSVTSIGEWAFLNCNDLTSVISEIKNPFEIAENVFYGVYTKATLTVPAGTKSKYQATNYWNKFTNIVESGGGSSTSRTINVATAGTLPNLISESEKYTIEELTLTGELNGTDFRLLRDMAGNNYKGEITEGKLKVLDLSGAKVVAGGEKYLDTDKIYYNNNSSSSTGSWHLSVNDANIMPPSVFEGCEKLSSVSIPNSVTGIDVDAFKNCSGLTTVTIPSSVTSIGGWAFSYCSSLTSITIPNTVTEIGINPFGYCSALSAVSVQSGNTKYDSRNNCNAIIETSSNKLITGCKNTVIPATVTRIGDTAFGGCTGLASVTFPNSVTSIDDYAFQMCTRLGSVTLPNALTTIGTFAFFGCALTAITIPGSVTSIGDFAFNLCLDLNAVTSEIVNPFAISDMVFSTYSSATLTVPSGTKSKYLATSGWNKFATIEEKLNDGEVVFLADNIEYKGNKNTQKAAVQSVENSLTQVVIPASVTYGGQTYQVTSIADDILSNRTFSYVSLPSTITSISSSTFRGSTLGALIWNADATLSSSVFSNMSNRVDANFLLYVNNQSYAPSNVKNVVVGYTASSITLADAKNTMFYCPKAFIATTISYTHKYSMETGGTGKGWESIALPFDVQKIEHATKGKLTPFASYNPSYSNQRPFWLYEMGSNGFRKVSEIKANTPYIISMPNNSAYDEEYILTGNVTFSASNANVATTSPVSVTAGSKRFVPAFSVVEKSAAVYALNVTNDLVTDHGAYDAGSRFVSDLREVYPFEAYMTTSSSAPYLTIEFDNGATGLDEIPTRVAADETVVIYSLGGQKVVTCKQADFDSRWLNLPSGVYIVNGKKRIR